MVNKRALTREGHATDCCDTDAPSSGGHSGPALASEFLAGAFGAVAHCQPASGRRGDREPHALARNGVSGRGLLSDIFQPPLLEPTGGAFSRHPLSHSAGLAVVR